MNKTKRIILSLAIVFTGFGAALLPSVASAAPIEANKPGTNGGASGGVGGSRATSCGDIETSIIDCGNKGGNPVIDVVLQIINFLAVGVGLAVLGGIIWGGMLYVTSNGDSSKTKQGVTTIVNSIIGLILFMFMYALINYLVPGGIFS